MSRVDQAVLPPLRGRERSERASRTLMDEQGHLWRVREIRFADASPSLFFESESGFRRVRAYPADWQSLTDTELYELSWGT